MNNGFTRNEISPNETLPIAGFKVLPYTASNDGPVVGVNLLKQF